MRIVGGERRGLTLRAPDGDATRPTADRVRQALFDMLVHAPWGGREVIAGANVLDAFAGTGALGLEALSRGAADAVFMEQSRAARVCISANIATCRAEDRSRVLTCDVTRPLRATRPSTLVFLDPPYAQDLVPRALASLHRAGWLAPDCLVVAETGVQEDLAISMPPLETRRFGAAKLWIWRHHGEAV